MAVPRPWISSIGLGLILSASVANPAAGLQPGPYPPLTPPPPPPPEPSSDPAVAPIPAPANSKPTRPEGVGRWDTKLNQCTLVQGWLGLPQQLQQRQSCMRLRLEQNQAGLLSVRLLNPAAQQQFGLQTLVFGGLLAGSREPMRCNNDGDCKPHWPIDLEVATVASSLFNDQGQSNTLPVGHLARGSCRLERQRLTCEARDQEGRFWEAKASF
jgi:hypothetical protein